MIPDFHAGQLNRLSVTAISLFGVLSSLKNTENVKNWQFLMQFYGKSTYEIF